MTPEGKTDEQKRMTIRQQRILSDMRALDAQLEALIRKMATAQGSDKADAIADVLDELVRQRTEIHEEIMDLQFDTMRYMGSIAGATVSHSIHSAEVCPIMRRMNGMPRE